MLPSDKYAQNSTTTLSNGTVLKWTNQLKNIYALNEDTDLSIVYSNWNNNDILCKGTKTLYNYYPSCDMSLPDLGNNTSGVANNAASGWTRTYNNSPRVENVFSGVVLSDNNAGTYFWGYNPLKNSPAESSSGGNAKLLLDMDVNKMIFRVHFSAIKLSDLPTSDDYSADPTSDNYPSAVSISLKELYDHPDDYGIVSYSWDGCMVYGEEGGSNHWVSANIRPSFIMNNGDSIGGYCGKDPFGSYQGTANLSFTIPNGHVSGGGGSSTYNIVNHLEETYVMGHPFEFVVKPEGTYDTLGEAAKIYFVNQYGASVAATHRMYVQGDLIDCGSMYYHGVSSCSVQQVLSPYTLKYTDLKLSWHRLIKGSVMLAYMAAFGLYFSNDEGYDPDTDNLTPETLGDSDKIWLGAMGADGVTTGVWITDLDSYHGPNKDGKTSNPDYTPNGGGGGDDDDPWHGVDFGGTGAGGGGAFCSVYYMTPTQLSSLKTWSNTSAPEGFDMLPSIIGLQQLPISVSGVPTTVKFLKSAAITPGGESRVVDTGVSAGGGTGQPIAYSLGSITIDRRMQQRGEPYLDYDSTIELFLPFAGTFVLDTQAVMGRTISAQIVVDPVCGTAFAYAWVENNGEKMPIAYGGGPIAVDLPIASNQWGIARAAFVQSRGQAIQNVVKAGGEFVAGLIGMKTGAEAAGDRAYIAARGNISRGAVQAAESGTARALGAQTMSQSLTSATGIGNSIVSATQLNNTNYTAVNGGFGGSYAEWSQPFSAYVRITRPKFKKPDNFNHTQAVPCVETKKLSSCSGLTYCVNPDLSSVPCTQAEKIMITQALVGGVYAGGGE